jgi:hypothetical protein
MKWKLAGWLGVCVAAISLCGCISNEETVYNDVPRVKVEFENDKAARLFYEALSRIKDKHRAESKTEISIPFVFEQKRRVVSGENQAFNDAVARCDTNKDGRVTEQEALIFSEHPE